MTDSQKEWADARDALVCAVTRLGFPELLGVRVAGSLGSPKAIRRMTAYLQIMKPKRVEMIVDEMLAIQSEIQAWREKKASQEANARYNALLYDGFEDGDEDGDDKSGSDPA